MFKIQGIDDGGSDLGLIFGQDGSFAEGLVFPYSGDNNYIDRIAPIGNAFELFRNQVPSYCNAVALDEGTYKTVGVSFEFGGLDDSQSTKEELMILILEFFGGILTGTEELLAEDNGFMLKSWPNPFSDKINFSFILEETAYVSLDIYDLNGKKIKGLAANTLAAGTHLISWDGTSTKGNNMPRGMYLYTLKTNDKQQTGKIILTR